MVQGRLLRCAPEHLRHLSERENLSIDRDTGDKDKARTFTDIVQDLRFSKDAHVDLRSQHDHLSGKIFVRTPTEMPGSSFSGTRTETKPVVEPTVIPSATNSENQMSATHDASEPTLVRGTDETQDRESLEMETDDPNTTATVLEPPPVVQLVPPPPLPQHRIYGKREAAVVHERSVRPRIELPEEDELFVHSQLQSFRKQVQERVSDHGVEGIGDHTVFASSVGENLKTTSKDDSHLRRVTDDQGVELTFDASWKNMDKFQAKPNSSRDLIASTIRKSAEVTLRQLDWDGRKEFEVAKSAEIQSWLRYEAVTAALRSQYHHRDIMKMRWVLRYEESGKPRTRLVIIGCHDLCVGSDVRTEARVASRRGRSQFFMATAHNQFFIENGDVKNAFLQGTFDDKAHGEPAAEPVPELRKALNLREDEIVVLTKACYGLIDAP